MKNIIKRLFIIPFELFAHFFWYFLSIKTKNLTYYFLFEKAICVASMKLLEKYNSVSLHQQNLRVLVTLVITNVFRFENEYLLSRQLLHCSWQKVINKDRKEHLRQSSQTWTKYILWKTAFKKFQGKWSASTKFT